MLSTLDWALIEMWKDAGIPLEAVLRGIDATFDHYEQRPSKTRKVNGLGFCSQEVLAAAEDMKEAVVGRSKESERGREFDSSEIAEFLRRNASKLESAKLPSRSGIVPQAVAAEIAATLKELASSAETKLRRLEDLERTLTVLEEKLFAVLLAALADDEVIVARAQADHELITYRGKMPSAQIEQLRKQYVHKRLLEKYGVPRLSLFYM